MKKKALLITAMMLCLCGMQVNAAAAEATRTIINGRYVSSAADNSEAGKKGPVLTDKADNAAAETAAASDDNDKAGSVSENTASKTGAAVSGDAAGSASKNTAGGFDPDRLKLPESAGVLITLEGGKNTDTGRLTLMSKKSDGKGGTYWEKSLECTAKYGKNGLYKEKEGDSKTPVGVFKMGVPFGNKPAEEGFPADYIQVDDSCYWDGDSGSDRYNKLVSTKNYTDFKKSESEHLIKYGAYYNYCLDTGYNPDGTPHKGSAIFLHCAVNNENTHGCIAIPEDAMKTVLKTYKDNATYIAIYDAADMSAVYAK